MIIPVQIYDFFSKKANYHVVLLFGGLVVSFFVMIISNIVNQQNHKTTKQQDSKSVWKTVPIARKHQWIKISLSIFPLFLSIDFLFHQGATKAADGKTPSEPLNSFERVIHRQMMRTSPESAVNAEKSHHVGYDGNGGRQNVAGKQEKNRMAILPPLLVRCRDSKCQGDSKPTSQQIMKPDYLFNVYERKSAGHHHRQSDRKDFNGCSRFQGTEEGILKFTPPVLSKAGFWVVCFHTWYFEILIGLAKVVKRFHSAKHNTKKKVLVP